MYFDCCLDTVAFLHHILADDAGQAEEEEGKKKSSRVAVRRDRSRVGAKLAVAGFGFGDGEPARRSKNTKKTTKQKRNILQYVYLK
jgi:hypothetical protein